MSKSFWCLCKPVMWAEPTFARRTYGCGFAGLGMRELEKCADLELPIKKLKFSQFPLINASSHNDEVQEMVDILEQRFNLQSFTIDAAVLSLIISGILLFHPSICVRFSDCLLKG